MSADDIMRLESRTMLSFFRVIVEQNQYQKADGIEIDKKYVDALTDELYDEFIKELKDKDMIKSDHDITRSCIENDTGCIISTMLVSILLDPSLLIEAIGPDILAGTIFEIAKSAVNKLKQKHKNVDVQTQTIPLKNILSGSLSAPITMIFKNCTNPTFEVRSENDQSSIKDKFFKIKRTN